jgi:hypothetical protein
VCHVVVACQAVADDLLLLLLAQDGFRVDQTWSLGVNLGGCHALNQRALIAP